MVQARLLKLLKTASQQAKQQFRRDDEHLFHPNGCRWLWQEPYQLARHTQRFDVARLKEIASKAIDQKHPEDEPTLPEEISITRILQIGSNRTFALTPSNHERTILVKIPGPDVKEVELVTASEVATMMFARTVLNIPVPKVLAWGTEIGCPYILMDAANMNENLLADHWPNEDLTVHINILSSTLAVQRKLANASGYFHGYYGSLFLEKDVQMLGLTNTVPLKNHELGGRFVLGCDVNLTSLGLGQKGPWSNPFDYLKTISQTSRQRIGRQMKLLQEPSSALGDLDALAKVDRDDINTKPLFTLLEGDPDYARCLELLDIYDSVIPQLIPQANLEEEGAKKHNEIVIQPTLWHDKLSENNICIDPDTGEIASITDWQFTSVLPLYIQAGTPPFTHIDDRLAVTELPEGFAEMSESDRTRIQSRQVLTLGRDYYFSETMEVGSLAMKVMSALLRAGPYSFRKRLIPVIARSAFTKKDNELLLLNMLAYLAEDQISYEDKEPLRSLGPKLNEAKDRIEDWEIPVSEAGWVSEERFEYERDKLKSFVKATFAAAENDKEKKKLAELINSYQLTK